MKRISLDYIVKGTKGKLFAKAQNDEFASVSSVEIDNRRMKDECLFFCIVGARLDAHTLLPDVREKGCHNVVVSNEIWAKKISEYGDMNVILVDDTVEALGNLAEKYMSDWKGLHKLAITGSCGKTTTKEFLYSIMSSKYKTGKNIGNYNSETGIPLTIFNSFEEDIEVSINEIGIGDGRDMKYLAEIVKPEVAIVTNVGSVHMEFFESSREKLLEAKLRITEPFTADNKLVVNNCEDNLSIESIRAHSKNDFQIVTVGDKLDSDYRISDIVDKGIDGVSGKLHVDGTIYDIEIPIIGAHNLYNATLAIAVGEMYGISIEQSLTAIKNIDMAEDRLDVHRGKYTIINDTYNANPEALKAAIEIVKHTPAKRKGLIVGSMGELGDDAAEIHRNLAGFIAESGFEYVATVGDLAGIIADELKEKHGLSQVYKYEDFEDLMTELESKIIKQDDLILIKGSNALGLNRIVREIEK